MAHKLIKKLATTPHLSGNTYEVIELVENHMKKVNVKTLRSYTDGL